MAKISEIIGKIEQFAPLELAESWDNSGWQVCADKSCVEKIFVCTSFTEYVLNKAIEVGAGMIISHHPVIFPNISVINDKKLIKAIQNNIVIYSAHTNMDKTNGGLNDYLANNILNLRNVTSFDFLRIGEVDEITLDNFILSLKLKLNLEKVRAVNYQTSKIIKKVALCTGSGSEFIQDAINHGADLFITSDLKYHNVLDVENLSILDIGHLESERHFTQIIKNVLMDVDVEIIDCNEKTPWTFI